MEKSIKLWQAIVATLVLIISTISMIVSVSTSLSNKLENAQLRIEFLENDSRDKGLQIKDLNQAQAQQYKEINSKLTDILISLQNKENKK